jgi:hypothetical protein
MGKLNSSLKKYKWLHEETINILSHKGNANQNITEISSHPSPSVYHQENK